MERAMRRKDRIMDVKKVKTILKNAEYGILSTVSNKNQPYGVPISFIYEDEKIYFHCAQTGEKIDNINYNKKVSFSVVGKTKPIYDKNFTTYYESVIAFGNAELVKEDDEKIDMLAKLCLKYLPEHKDKIESSIKGSLNRTAVYKINIETLTGKEKA